MIVHGFSFTVLPLGSCASTNTAELSCQVGPCYASSSPCSNDLEQRLLAVMHYRSAPSPKSSKTTSASSKLITHAGKSSLNTEQKAEESGPQSVFGINSSAGSMLPTKSHIQGSPRKEVSTAAIPATLNDDKAS
eukprot:2349899-Amphidinium_carterae.1